MFRYRYFDVICKQSPFYFSLKYFTDFEFGSWLGKLGRHLMDSVTATDFDSGREHGRPP